MFLFSKVDVFLLKSRDMLTCAHNTPLHQATRWTCHQQHYTVTELIYFDREK
jgi:hypothetical protein